MMTNVSMMDIQYYPRDVCHVDMKDSSDQTLCFD